MNETELLKRLDERGRRAAASLRDATPDLPAGPPDRAFLRPPPRPHLRILLAAALVGALVAAAALITLRDDAKREDKIVVDRPGIGTKDPEGENGDPPVDGEGGGSEGTLGRYEPKALPKGFALSAAGKDTSAAWGGTTVVYGPPESSAAFDGPTLLVNARQASGPDVPGWERSDLTLAIHGRPAGYRPEDPELPGMRTVVYEPEPGLWVTLSSRHLDQGALVGMATYSTVINGIEIELPPTLLPAGWAKLFIGSDSLFRGDLLHGTGSSILRYTDGDGGSLSVAVGSGEPREVDASRAALAEVRDVDVRGHRAVAGHRFDREGTRVEVVTWQERPQELVRLTARGIDADELEAIAEDLVAMTDDAFEDEYQRRMAPLTEDLSEVQDGVDRDGAPWALRAGVVDWDLASATAGEPSFWLELRHDGVVQMAAAPLADVGPGADGWHVKVADDRAGSLFFGYVPDTATRVVVEAIGAGSGVEVELVPAPGEDVAASVFVGQLPPDTMEAMFFAYAEDGTLVAEMLLSVDPM